MKFCKELNCKNKTIKVLFIGKVTVQIDQHFYCIFIFEMAAIPFPCKGIFPFPCNGILLIQGNLPRVILVFTLNYASFLIPHFNLLFSFIGNGLAFPLLYFLDKYNQMISI